MRFLVTAVSLAAGVFLLLNLGAGSTPAEAARITMEGFATGGEEVPALPHPWRVAVRFVFDDQTRELTYQATVSGLSPNLVTAAHIHRGARGVNGPVIYPLSTVGFTQVAGTLRLTEADVADLMAGNLYFNAHSVENPGGFARFQLIVPSAGRDDRGGDQARAGAGPATVSPPRTGDAGLLVQEDESGVPWRSLAVLAGVLSFVGAAAAMRRRLA